MNFREFYKFPLKLDIFGNIVLTDENERAFDFFEDITGEEGYVLNRQLQHSLVNCLNNENIHFIIRDAKYFYKNTSIYIIIDDKPLLFINIRGWGNLTEELQLSSEKAKEIQNEFSKFIIKKLSF